MSNEEKLAHGFRPHPAIVPDPDFAADHARLVTLHEGGSIQFIKATRESIRRLADEGWTFDDETAKWAGVK